MSPSRRRRRRVLAAPFVVTVAALAPGCTVKSAPPPTSPQPEEGPATRYDQNGNEVTSGESGTTSGERPRLIANPPAPGTLPDPPKDGKGSIQTRDDGTCWYYVKIDCPAGVACNPPPPQQVKCETDS